MKTCTKCGGHGPFQRDRTKKDGMSCRCKTCLNAYALANRDRRSGTNKSWRLANLGLVKSRAKTWYESNRVRVLAAAKTRYTKAERAEFARRYTKERKAFIDSLKAGKPCVDCARNLPLVCMDFDHVRGEKVASVSQMVSCAEASILAEVAKCDLVCANCHRVRTEQRRGRSNSPYRKAISVRVEGLKAAPCSDCSGNFPPVAMDFDHVRGEKLNNIGSMTSWDRILVEVAKCDLVCANCHRLRTHARLRGAD